MVVRDLLSLLWVPHPSVLRVGCLFRCTPPAAPWLFYGRINALRYSRYVPAFAHELVALGLGTLCILLGGFYAAPTKVPALVLPLPRIERLSGCPGRRGEDNLRDPVIGDAVYLGWRVEYVTIKHVVHRLVFLE